MKTTKTYVFYPVCERNKAKLAVLLIEILATLSTRADGVEIEIERDTAFPPLDPPISPNKGLITGVKIKTWDIAA